MMGLAWLGLVDGPLLTKQALALTWLQLTRWLQTALRPAFEIVTIIYVLLLVKFGWLNCPSGHIIQQRNQLAPDKTGSWFGQHALGSAEQVNKVTPNNSSISSFKNRSFLSDADTQQQCFVYIIKARKVQSNSWKTWFLLLRCLLWCYVMLRLESLSACRRHEASSRPIGWTRRIP